MGIPMGIPTGFLWEWDGNGNGNSIPTATVLIADGPFFAPCWGWIWDVMNYPDTNITYNLPG